MGLKITNLPISNYMTAYPISVNPNVPLMEAIHFMADRGFGNLVVSDGTTPKGILTEREILKAISESKNLNNLKIQDVGWQPYVKLSLGYTVLDAAHQMIRKKSRLLVFDQDKLVGIVTISDLLRAFRKTHNDSTLDNVVSNKLEKCKSSDSVFYAVRKLHEKRIGSIIIDDMKGYGIFTERDLLTHIVSGDFNLHDSVGKHSSSPLIVADIGIKVHDVASMMASKNIKRLGLVKNGLLVGVATARDVVDAYQNEYPVTNPYMEDLSEYISG